LTETLDPVVKQTSDTQELAAQLLEQAKTEGLDLIGPDGLLNQLTKNGAGDRLGGGDDRAPGL
jgi:hypothetical protein